MKKMKTIGKTAAMASLATMVLASCASANKAQKSADNMQATKMEKNMENLDNDYLILSDEQNAAIDHTNAFALNLMRTLTGMEPQVVSPLSVAYLMGMLANGANGDTQKEIMATLNMDANSINSLNESYRAVISMASKHDRQTTINIANIIAANKNISIKPEFAKLVGDMYKADVESIDFSSPKALKHINGLCKKQTEGMIPSIIDQLDPNTISVLMNAIYFNGTWTNKFDPNQTKEENFRGYTRDIRRVKMMHNEHEFQYTENNDFAAVRLPYGNGTYSMTVILPNEDKSVSEIINGLDTKKLHEMNESMEKCIVDLKLPRFSTTTETKLNNPIAKLGAPSMFQSDKADFSNMSATSMYVSAMLQKAKIEVSEEGTKAAAVTASIMTMSALPDLEPRRVSFHANRPFIYMITEENTGAIFFIGEYV